MEFLVFLFFEYLVDGIYDIGFVGIIGAYYVNDVFFEVDDCFVGKIFEFFYF